jgi:hypothetical protein
MAGAITFLWSGSLGFAAGGALLFGFVYLHEDVGQIQSRTLFQLWTAVAPIQEWAKANGGRYPESVEAAAPLLATSQLDAEDPWGRPYRYELVTPDGSQARVYTLGKDGRPGGTRIDEDIVYWMSASGEAMTWDVNDPPTEWYEPPICVPGVRR